MLGSSSFQDDLFPANARLPAIETPAARATDPVTSHIAAEEVTKSGLRGRQQKEVYEALRKFPGRTSAELAVVACLDRHAVARRLPELKKAGFATYDEEERRLCWVTNRPCVVWRLPQPSLSEFSQMLVLRFGLEELRLSWRGAGTIYVAMIRVPSSLRCRGIGSLAMRVLVDYAESNGYVLALSPADEADEIGTTSRERLVRFYQRFGFVENAGADPRLPASAMVRRPK